MLQKLKSLFLKHKNKKKSNVCENCIWWKAEEENIMPIHKDKDYGYCGINKNYNYKKYSCGSFSEELFEATENSISTPELEINIEIDFDGKEDSQNDTRREI